MPTFPCTMHLARRPSKPSRSARDRLPGILCVSWCGRQASRARTEASEFPPTLHAGSLDSVHFVFDEQAGFSALLKMFDHDPQAAIEHRDFARTGVWTLRAPMLALSQPDPALAFPEGTTLRPELFIRNTTAKPETVSLIFNWRNLSTAGKALGPTLRLAPFETRRVDVAALQDGKTLPKDANWTAVVMTTSGLPDEVMAIAASYDKTLRYGAQTPFSDQLSFKWEGGPWEYDGPARFNYHRRQRRN